MKRLFFLLAVFALVAGAIVPAMAQRGRDRAGGSELAYGSAPLQRLDYWAGKDRNAPLVVFVHGGGWKRGDKKMMQGSAKLEHWQAQGYAVASVNYRLVPDATVEQQAADVASAVAYLRDNAARLGFDSERIVLIGHSAGAHLVALVGTDPQWLRGVGMKLSDIAGVVPLDGAAYDVPAQMGENAPLLGDTYKQAFGTDPVRQRALSPTFQAAAPNAPAFLILHVERKDGTAQSKALGEALRKAGTDATVQGFKGRGLRGHAEINRKLGEPDYPATAVVDAFLKKAFG
ncbi:alpha/beta hydrolase [Erythrobacter sp. SDW2]|uniref:alpha/beta hydrolase n=1 Tax=Erythrobacter sp. SDW2 TaxID=2907154 RepID=UPI001F405848|nr:alpha/beta hydrolase [Erythrobacter sp. SDW2]UIP08232.1 alpha/beta hydrolase [Erythrobacter sp. SDW2]